MKKSVAILLFLAMMFSSVVVYANEATIVSSDEIVLLVGSNQSLINGEITSIDSEDKDIKPIIKNNRTLIPIRFVSENFGANVKWDANTSTITITLDDQQLELVLGSPEMKKNGKVVPLEIAPESINDRAYLPLRAISEAIGKEIFYKNGLIVISNEEVNYSDNYVVSLINKLNNGIVLMVDSNKSIVNGTITRIDSTNNQVTPVIKNNRTLVPIRFISDQFGAEVLWDGKTQTISIAIDNNQLELVIGVPKIIKNGATTKLDVAPEIINGRTYLPIRAISEAIGKDILYKNYLIIISDGEVEYLKETIDIFVRQLKAVQKTKSDIINEIKESVVLVQGLNNGTIEVFGSGFFVGDGLIMTSAHVIDGYEDFIVEDYASNEYKVDGIYKFDITRDLVVLKLNKIQTAKPLPFADLNTTKIGEKVISVGHSDGQYWSVNEGVISSFIEDEFMGVDFIETDTAVSFGGSGGPLLNSNGEVVGVISSGVEEEGINYASIPDGIFEVNYQDVNFNNITLIPDEFFILSNKEETKINDLINNNLKGLVTNDKSLYLSTIHPESPYLELETESFDDFAPTFNGYAYQLYSVESEKYGDTVISIADVSLTKENEPTYDATMVSRLVYTEGQYQFMVTILVYGDEEAGQPEDQIEQTPIEETPLEIVDNQLDFYQNIDFKPYDVKFDHDNGLIYMIDKSSKSLVKYSIYNKTMTKQTFKYIPERLDLEDGKVYVTLVTTDHSSYTWQEDQRGYIGVVNADTLEVNKIINIGFDPYDVAAKDGYIYVSGGSAQWTQIRSYSEETGIEIESASIRQMSPIEIHPSGDRLYTITTDLSPRDMTVYMIDKGRFTTSYDSIYHSEYDMAVGFTFSPDGKFIFNHSGVIFKTGYGRDSDIQYHNKFNKGFNSVAFDIPNNKTYINIGNAGLIYVYDYTSLQGIGTMETLTKADFMTVIGDKLITIENDGGSNGINVLELN